MCTTYEIDYRIYRTTLTFSLVILKYDMHILLYKRDSFILIKYVLIKFNMYRFLYQKTLIPTFKTHLF
jgi:hypothetical protein